MSATMAHVLRTIPPGWHVVDAWADDAFGTTRERVAESAADYLRELQTVRDDPLRLVVTEAHVRALGTRIAVWVVAVIARDDAPPVDFPEPAS